MNLLWIQIRRLTLHSQTLCLPLSPSSELMWLGLSDLGSPVLMDADDIIKVYNKRSSLWKVASNMNGQVISIFTTLYVYLNNNNEFKLV